MKNIEYLKLNEDIPKASFEEFYGSNADEMPKLVEDGQVPLSTAGLLQQRLSVLYNSSNNVQSSWWNNFFDTGDGVLYNANGKIKVVRDVPLFRDLKDSDHIVGGALMLSDCYDEALQMYDAFDGPEFDRKDLEKFVDRNLTITEVKSHPIWNAIVGDESLLCEYADMIFAKGKTEFGCDEMMSVSLDYAPQCGARGRMCNVWKLQRSGLNFKQSVHDPQGRLIGVKQKTVVPSVQRIAHNVRDYLAITPSLKITQGDIEKVVFDACRN
jgi:hypothetical protein